MKTRAEIIKVLSKNKSELEKRFKVKRLALFGSYARGEQKNESDVDILVDVDPSIGLEFVTLAETIEKMLGTDVEVVSLKAIKPRALKLIEQELIYV
jgi:predicted nucleotidyltransferase